MKWSKSTYLPSLLWPWQTVLPLLLLCGLWIFSPGLTSTDLALNHRNPQFYQFYTSAFVHANTGHLLGNLVGYVVTVTPLYFLFAHQDRRREFWRAFVLILAVAPIVSSVASYAVWSVALDFTVHYGRGFSGVVAAFAGLLLMTVLSILEEEQSEPHSTFSTALLLTTLLGTWTITFTGVLRYLMVALLVAMLGVIVWASARGELSPVGIGEWVQANFRLAQLLTVGGFAALLVIVASFPNDLASGKNFADVVGHGAGFAAGVAVFSVVQYWNTRSAERRLFAAG